MKAKDVELNGHYLRKKREVEITAIKEKGGKITGFTGKYLDTGRETQIKSGRALKPLKKITSKARKDAPQETEVSTEIKGILAGYDDLDKKGKAKARRRLRALGYSRKEATATAKPAEDKPDLSHLSPGYRRYLKEFGEDPHCSACRDRKCDSVGDGDDACSEFVHTSKKADRKWDSNPLNKPEAKAPAKKDNTRPVNTTKGKIYIRVTPPKGKAYTITLEEGSQMEIVVR